ncbi:MAG TPA: hypothetical protein VNR87_01920 [Flavisolibacter sp.]|nr:hypothetical protein [Flavisolibacter sp.]
MTNKGRQHIILAIAIAATFIPLLLIEARVLSFTKGMFIYPVDDTFIHMELAKNLAQNGNWGINSHEFSSASSSILYTLLLALLFKIFSVSTLFPMIINAIAGLGLLVAINRWLGRQQLSFTAQLLIILGVIFITPLPVLVMSGMQHTLQCLFSFLFLFGVSDWIALNRRQGELKWHLPWSIPVLALLVTAIRYEGLFMVATACLVLLMYKKIGAAFRIGLFGLMPVVIFGLYAISKGSYFLPNSVLIKSEEVSLFSGGIGHFFEAVLVEKLTLARAGITAMATQRLLLMLPATAVIFYRFLRPQLSYLLILAILTFCTFLHLTLASTGKFYRYEAYLVLCSAVVTATVFAKYTAAVFSAKPGMRHVLGLILLFFLALPLLLRVSAAYTKAGRACINIYEQQYQMGRFLQKFYPDEGVAANDIGAVAYFTNGRVVDLWGLGDFDIAKSRRKKYWTPSFLDTISRRKNARLAIVYDSWFNDSLGRHWQKLATWKIP